MTQLGAALDTVADKALGVVTLVMLTQAGAIPLWVTLAILLRDSIIVLGALSYRGLAGQDAHVCGTVVAVAGVGRPGRAAVAGRLAACSVRRRLHHRRGFRRAVCVDMGRQGAARTRGDSAETALIPLLDWQAALTL